MTRYNALVVIVVVSWSFVTCWIGAKLDRHDEGTTLDG